MAEDKLKIKQDDSKKYSFKTKDNESVSIEHKNKNLSVKMNKWGDEASLEITFDDFKSDDHSFSDNKVELDDGKCKIRAYPIETRSTAEFYGDTTDFTQCQEGGFRFDLTFNENPGKNVFVIPIKTKNLRFSYQKPLTIEEIESGSDQPINVDGSYAVYHISKKNNKYKAGKAFHVYRPVAEDADGNKAWCDISFNKFKDPTKFTLTVPQQFLDEAVYPIIIDPDFGYESIGGSTRYLALGDSTSNRSGCSWDMPAGGGDTTYLKAYMAGDATADVKAFINEEDSGGSGTHGQIETEENAACSASPHWEEFTLGGETLVATTSYLLNVVANGPGLAKDDEYRIYRDGSGDANNSYQNYGGSNYASPESPWTEPTETGSPYDYSIFVGYSTGPVTETKTFTADAMLMEVGTKTFTSDAILKKTSTRTFTADAFLQKTDTKTFTADAQLQKTETKTFTSDAVVVNRKTKTFDADAFLQKTDTKTFDVDAILKKTDTRTFEADAILKKTQTKTLTADSIVVNRLTKTFTADAILINRGTKTFDADSILRKVQEKTFTINALLKGQNTKTFAADATLEKEGFKTFSADAQLQKTDTKTFTSDAIIVNRLTKTFSADAFLLNKVLKTFEVDAQIQKTDTKTFTVDSLIRKTETKTFSADSIVVKRLTKTFDVDAIVVNRLTKTFEADSMLSKVSTKDFTTNALLQKIDTKAFDVNAILKGTFTKDFTVDAFVLRRILKTFSADSTLVNRFLKTFSANSIVVNRLTKTFSADSIVVNRFTKSFDADSLIRLTSTKTLEADALLQKTQTKTFSANAIILEPLDVVKFLLNINLLSKYRLPIVLENLSSLGIGLELKKSLKL